MSKKTHIDVTISVESIRDGLRKLLISEHSALITKVIIGQLEKTDVGLEQLYKAMSGVQDKLKYKIGDYVMVSMDILHTWKFDKNKSEIAGLVKQNRMRGLIESVDPFLKYPYTIDIEVIDSMNQTVHIHSPANDRYVCLEEEWPGDGPDSDLPF